MAAILLPRPFLPILRNGSNLLKIKSIQAELLKMEDLNFFLSSKTTQDPLSK